MQAAHKSSTAARRTHTYHDMVVTLPTAQPGNRTRSDPGWGDSGGRRSVELIGSAVEEPEAFACSPAIAKADRQ
jgi:hypothetical protein